MGGFNSVTPDLFRVFVNFGPWGSILFVSLVFLSSSSFFPLLFFFVSLMFVFVCDLTSA